MGEREGGRERERERKLAVNNKALRLDSTLFDPSRNVFQWRTNTPMGYVGNHSSKRVKQLRKVANGWRSKW